MEHNGMDSTTFPAAFINDLLCFSVRYGLKRTTEAPFRIQMIINKAIQLDVIDKVTAKQMSDEIFDEMLRAVLEEDEKTAWLRCARDLIVYHEKT